MGPVETGIIQKLEKAFSPAHLEVINESASHNVPEGSESHFKVVIVSDSFNGLSAVKRHQSVYAVLADELKSTVHALAIHAYMQEEWSKTAKAPDSPKCMGGSQVYLAVFATASVCSFTPLVTGFFHAYLDATDSPHIHACSTNNTGASRLSQSKLVVATIMCFTF